ncbi:NADPH:quinone reductase [Actinocrinis sp.]|uniref:NADPH:quinone reductase n=1 Tax=Actinocrinis sp. TaxID=1920516 RepID=UPI002D41039D|nr:NADPH:quinone reductase [Actinocrinis sp.]HZP51737.1 NADPH:quinone reductase [Actinocrinis sp.]
MQAAYIEKLGPPEAICVGELPDPIPGPTDVLVDVLATTVNPVDTFVRSGVFRTAIPFPFVIARDVVGTVAQAPAGTGFAPGDLVWCNSLGHEGRQGAAAERAVVPADRLYRVPAGVDPRDAVAVVHPGATAHLALFAHGRLRPGETVFVAGAAGNVGAALVAMVVRAGAHVVATASTRDFEYCRSLGAEEVFDYADEDLAGRLHEARPAGYDLWIDSYGVNDLGLAVDLLAARGRIVLLAGVAARPVLPVGPFYMKDAAIHGFVISHATAAELAAAAAGVNGMLTQRLLAPRAVEECTLAEAAEAHRRMERGELRGRRLLIVIDPLRWKTLRKGWSS